jgi:hypothetical protein
MLDFGVNLANLINSRVTANFLFEMTLNMDIGAPLSTGSKWRFIALYTGFASPEN